MRGSAARGKRRGRTRPLTDPAAWRRVREVLGDPAARLLVAMDLDGTIAPIVSKPERARVPAATLRLLGEAASRRGVQVVILSARPRSDLKAMIPVRSIQLVGQYGLEGPLAPPTRERTRIRRAVRLLAGALEALAAGCPGAWVEAKGLSVAVHDRAVARTRLPSLHRALRDFEARSRKDGFEVSLGRRITDFVPRGRDKGGALRRLRARYRPAATFYFGDSPADEPAFAALGGSDFGIRVGSGATRARYRVRDLGGVRRFLSEIASLRSRSA